MSIRACYMLLTSALLLSISTLTVSQPRFKITEITDQLDSPWSLAELPDGQLLITERRGRLIRINADQVHRITGVPDVLDVGQGGLLDIKLHPRFAENSWLYLSYAQGTRGSNRLRLMRAKLEGNQLTDQQVIFSASPDKSSGLHFAGRIAFLPDNTLLLSVGDGYRYMDQAQEKDSLLGKIIRLDENGKAPADNPFAGNSGSAPEIYSYGHRNPQGLIYDPVRQQVFSNEHGPKGGDEINIIQPGNNYGWPVITYGVDYSGLSITPYRERPGMEQPLVDWTPSIAPSSITVYYGNMFPELQGDLLSTTLKARHLRHVEMDGNQPVAEHELLGDLNERLRFIHTSMDGSLYLLTDSGKLLHLTSPD
ncbi:PQQ-dependent sugar dehydrogenase [Aliamphritea spongicola]|uniref:PQQ-dependent sugar dehydrogenase n=1 Tax=Aliamphritea spongicola TaxID=707589 RepID=UPI00196B9831|nr:PQQ-dependent sugar dehydrogenase [Aliamphritea spongicola]MBN3563780.1 PQQ-dependent sugar dehydrogenase [Aliamphritea spongicola]